MRMEGELGPEAAAGVYEALVREHLGNDPRFDLVLLGMGPDAHVASLFPGKPELEETRRLVVGVPLAGMEPQVPRVTLTLPVLNRARVVDFLVAGADKAQAVARAFGDPPDPDAPAARVRPEDGSIFVFVDEAAAALLLKGQFIGLDVGGTKIASATLQDGKLTTRELIKTNVADGDALVDQLVELIGHLRTDETVAAGVGLPSIIEFETGRIAHSVNIPLHDLPLRKLLTERAGIPVYIENDASCAALAEAFDEDGSPRVPEPRDVHRRHGRRRRDGLQRAPLPRRDERRRDRPHRDRARPRGRARRSPRASTRCRARSSTSPRAGRSTASPSARPKQEEDSFLGKRLRRTARSRATTSSTAPRPATPTRCACSTSSASGSASGSPTRSTSSTREEIVIGGGVSIAGDLLLDPARTRRRALHGAGAGPAHDDPARAPRRPGRRARRGDGRRAGGGEGRG